ncbi:MAG: hypothetical protein KME06_09665 [Kastovskya adunca ATA6-11-RM4]|jgi:hypothetical protein|nr:hypothetical protein [Kastovskya adunca ATA6-11-RM4]
MHPIALLRKWNLSYTQLANELHLTEATVRAWGFRSTAKKFRHPSDLVQRTCQLLDEKWEREKKAETESQVA